MAALSAEGKSRATRLGICPAVISLAATHSHWRDTVHSVGSPSDLNVPDNVVGFAPHRAAALCRVCHDNIPKKCRFNPSRLATSSPWEPDRSGCRRPAPRQKQQQKEPEHKKRPNAAASIRNGSPSWDARASKLCQSDQRPLAKPPVPSVTLTWDTAAAWCGVRPDDFRVALLPHCAGMTWFKISS